MLYLEPRATHIQDTRSRDLGSRMHQAFAQLCLHYRYTLTHVQYVNA
jgi:hypothetical protein